VRTFTLYSRRGCHLCDEMLGAVEALQTTESFSWKVVDIDSENELVLRYGDRVPVLVDSAGTEICAIRFDKAAFMLGLG
jgi:hypothetical protein